MKKMLLVLTLVPLLATAGPLPQGTAVTGMWAFDRPYHLQSGEVETMELEISPSDTGKFLQVHGTLHGSEYNLPLTGSCSQNWQGFFCVLLMGHMTMHWSTTNGKDGGVFLRPDCEAGECDDGDYERRLRALWIEPVETR